jgi:hypothetical protein
MFIRTTLISSNLVVTGLLARRSVQPVSHVSSAEVKNAWIFILSPFIASGLGRPTLALKEGTSIDVMNERLAGWSMFVGEKCQHRC